MKLTLLQILNPFSLVQEYQRFGGIYTLHLQDVLKEVVVFSQLHPLPVCPTHNVSI